jgi:hypothetical protein
MTNMTDQGRSTSLMGLVLNMTATSTLAATGATSLVVTLPWKLRLMTAQAGGAGNVSGSNGTEMTTEYGYTVGGLTMGTAAWAAVATSATSNANIVSWSATGTWPTIPAIEIWDSSATPLRWFQGALTASITGVANGDTVSFAVGSITLNMTAW